MITELMNSNSATNVMTTESHVRKRKRPTIVCQRCRVKKSKCDKAQPCLNCVKAKCPETCVYESELKREVSPPKLSSVPLDWNESIEKHLKSHESANRLQMFSPSSSVFMTTPTRSVIVESNDWLIGVNPVVRSTDMLNMHMDLMAMNSASGSSPDSSYSQIKFKCVKDSTRTISQMEISQQEPGARLFWNFNESKKKLKLLTIQNFLDNRLRVQLQEETRMTFGHKYIDLYTYGLGNIYSNSIIRKQFADYGASIGVSFLHDFEFMEGDSFNTALMRLLPLRPALLAYVDRFFQNIYPLFPVLDEKWLLTHIQRLLVYSSDGSALLDVCITSKDDLLILAILLFALRMAYLSFLTNVRILNESILDMPREWGLTLRQSEISLNCVDVAIRLLNSGRYHKKTLLVNFQAHLLRAVTQIYALENETTFNIQDPDCNIGQLVHMATTLNLDRDPDYVEDNLPTDEASKNLRRKLWYVLVRMDYIISYTFLSPRCILASHYNTKLPDFSPLGMNIVNAKVEEETVQLMMYLHEIICGGSELLDICVDMRNPHRAIDVICKLNDFEILIDERLGRTQMYFDGSAPNNYSTYALTVLQMQTQVLLKLFLANVYYFLHLYYCYQGVLELDNYFFRKLLLIAFNEMNHFCPELMFSTTLIADPTFNLIMTPVILIYLHVIAILGVGFVLRIHCTMFILERDQKNELGLRVVRDMGNRIETFLSRKLKLCKLLSERYFYGWKCSKANGFGYNIIYDNRTYSGDLEGLAKAKLSWSDRHQMDILDLIPEEVPIQMSDVGDVRQHCYYSVRSLNDSDLKGLDLYKTIQTDNFWITFNSISERDSYAAALAKGKELHPSAPEIVPGVGSVVNYDLSIPPLGVGTPRTELPVPALEKEFPELVGPASNDMFDINFFSTDWSIDQFFPPMN